MAQEEKQLLVKDICNRLPYGVFVEENRNTLDPDPAIYTYDYHPCIDNCKPYLRPMSSMTEEELYEYQVYIVEEKDEITKFCNMDIFFNSKHLDYRGLIEKGLALEAPKNMYQI